MSDMHKNHSLNKLADKKIARREYWIKQIQTYGTIAHILSFKINRLRFVFWMLNYFFNLKAKHLYYCQHDFML